MNIIELMLADGRTKGVRCLCGKGFTMLCAMPMAETDREHINEFAKYARKGRRIEMMERDSRPPLCDCKGPEQPKGAPLPDLFSQPAESLSPAS